MFQHGITWPFAALDFEASSLDPELSYPVEVGVAVWDGSQAPVRVWSTTIAPHPAWVRDGIWTEAAQKVHGISPRDLERATPAADVMRRLNALLSRVDGVASDNPWWEDFWLRRLATAAGIAPAFTVTALSDRIARIGPSARTRMADHVAAHPRPHAAGEDARLVVCALAAALERSLDVQVEGGRP